MKSDLPNEIATRSLCRPPRYSDFARNLVRKKIPRPHFGKMVLASSAPFVPLEVSCETLAPTERGRLPPLVQRLAFWAEPFILSI